MLYALQALTTDKRVNNFSSAFVTATYSFQAMDCSGGWDANAKAIVENLWLTAVHRNQMTSIISFGKLFMAEGMRLKCNPRRRASPEEGFRTLTNRFEL